MLGYALKKLMYNLSLCLTAYMLIFFFSRYQRVYAGWFAGAAGMIVFPITAALAVKLSQAFSREREAEKGEAT